MSDKHQSPTVAFALGGLGGSNAHGAGFLAAARKRGIRPKFISCTTGAIPWVRRYLENADIAAEIRAADRMFNWFPRAVNLLNWPSMLLSGVFRPAVSEYWMRWMTPFSPFLAKEWVARIAPAQSLVPTRPEEWFHEVAETFNRSDIGIMFNVFEPKSGIGYLHTNKAGLKLLDKKEGEWDHGRVRYAPITAKAVKDALWLYLYGFESQELLDGAYHRQIILRELHPFDRIYAVRPQNQRWIGALPRTGFELRDLEIELWFNSSYAAECAGIELTNSLLTPGHKEPNDKDQKDKDDKDIVDGSEKQRTSITIESGGG